MTQQAGTRARTHAHACTQALIAPVTELMEQVAMPPHERPAPAPRPPSPQRERRRTR
ncbi:hypothetical protein [Nonomuraea sp. KM90]|uniref:hypothetical protein n=1 Tax=Nonomuraea sp. KM90 TaxID=3457428 RepID=UPI003FCC7C50